MALQETLDLDIAAALRGVDSIDDALAQLTSRFRVGLADALDVLRTPAEVTIDAPALTSAVSEAIAGADAVANVTLEGLDAASTSVTEAVDAGVAAADTHVAVDVDAGNVTDDVTAAIDAADTTVNVAVDVETPDVQTDGIDAASDSLGALRSEATETGRSLGDVGSAATIVNTSATLAAGQMSALKQSLPSQGLLGGVATGLVAVAGAGTFFARSAIDAQQAEERWNRTLGESADAVAQIDVGGLATDIDSLASAVGSDDDALRLATADLFELGLASGAARPQVEGTSKEIVALTARAVALRPALGEAGDNLTGLTNALARGGRSLTSYGLSLTSAEIEARALGDTGKDTAADLTVYDKAAAGAAIATERLGNSLATDVAAGSASGVIQLRTLAVEFGNFIEEVGAPLAPQFISVMREAQPVLRDVAGAVGELAGEALPLLVDGLHAAEPAISAVSSAVGVASDALGGVVSLVEAIPDPLVEGAVAFAIYNRLLTEAAVASGLYSRAKVAETVATEAGAVADTAAAAAKLEYAGAAGVAARASGLAAGSTGALAGGAAGLVSPLGLVAAGLAVATVALSNHRKEQAETKRRVDELTASFKDQSSSFQEDIDALVSNQFSGLTNNLRDLGLGFSDIAEFSTRGDEGVIALVQHLEDTGQASDGVAAAFRKAREEGKTFGQAYNTATLRGGEFNDGAKEVILTLGKVQSAAQKSADATVLDARAKGDITDANLAAAEASNRLANGDIDHVAVLRQLIPQQEKVADAVAATAEAEKKTTEETDRLLSAFAAATVSQDVLRRGFDLTGPALAGLVSDFAAGRLSTVDFTQAVESSGLPAQQLFDILNAGRDTLERFADLTGDDLTRALDVVGPKFGAVAEAAARGTLTQDEYLAVLARTPLTAEELDGALDVVRESVNRLADDITGKLPDVSDAFASLGDTPGLDAFLKTIQRQATDAAHFLDNIQTLIDRHADDLAATLLEQGPAAATAAAQAAKLGDTALASREKQLDAGLALEQRNQDEARDLAITFGLDMLDIQTGNLSLLSRLKAPDLTKPLITAEQKAADSLASEGRILLAAAQRAALTGLDIRAAQLATVRSAGNRLGRELATGVEEGADSSALELFRAGERAASHVVEGAKEHLDISSPSRVGLAIGANYGLALASGLDSAASAVSAASTRLAQRMVLNVPAAAVTTNPAAVGPASAVTPNGTAVSGVRDIIVNEVANDPVATAQAVDAMLGARAAR